MNTKHKISDHAAVAKLCKQYLKAHNIAGTARSQTYSGGESVRVHVINQRPEVAEALEKEFSKYQYGHFDGMQDLYEYSNCNDGLPQIKFMFVNNDFTDDFKQSAWECMRGYIAGSDQLPEIYSLASNSMLQGEWVSTQIHRVLCGAAGAWSARFWNQQQAA